MTTECERPTVEQSLNFKEKTCSMAIEIGTQIGVTHHIFQDTKDTGLPIEWFVKQKTNLRMAGD